MEANKYIYISTDSVYDVSEARFSAKKVNEIVSDDDFSVDDDMDSSDSSSSSSSGHPLKKKLKPKPWKNP